MTATARSPLAHLHAAMAARAGGDARLRELPFRAQVTVHVDATNCDRLDRALGAELPRSPNRWRGGEPEAYWLGPDEWLLVGEPGTEAALETRLRAALADSWAAIVDVSDQRTTLELSGGAAADVLSGGCSLDLHPRAFGAYDCAQTLLGRAGVLIARGEDPHCFRLFVRSSFAVYLAEWLLDAIGALGR